MSNKRTHWSNLTVALQKKKNGGKNVASVTDYDIPYMERLAINGIFNHKKSCQSFSFTRADTDMNYAI